MKRKVMAILMAAALCVGLLPATTFAEAGEYSAEDAEDSAEETEVQAADIEVSEDGTATIVLGDAEGEYEQGEEEVEAEEPLEAEPEGDAEEAEAVEETAEDEAEPEEVVYTAKDGSVSVEVTAPYGALPEDAELKVERFATDSTEYKDAAEAIGLDEDDPNMAALDISFVADGEEVEPSKAVKVSIDASEILPDDADASTLEVQHLEEKTFGVEPVVVANDSPETEGTIDEAKAIAEFEVESFSAFTVTWTISTGAASGTTYRVSVTAYLDGTELNDVSNLEFTSENDELNFETLLAKLEYGTGDYTFSYAIATVDGTTYGSQDNPLVAIEIDQGTGGPTSTTNFLLVYADGTTGTVATTNTVTVDAYYTTPSMSVTIEAVESDEAEDWALQAVVSHAPEGASFTYDWSVTDLNGEETKLATVANSDNIGEAFIVWNTDETDENHVEDNDEVLVHVTVTATDSEGNITTASASYVLEYGDETIDLILTYGPDKEALPAGVSVTLTNNATGESYSYTTSDDGWVHDADIVPGIYTVEAEYTDDQDDTYRCKEIVAFNVEGGNYSVNLSYYDPSILTNVPDRDSWEHIDIKLSVGTSSSSTTGEVSVNIIGAQIIGSDGAVKYTATEGSIEGNDNEFQLTFYEGENTTGTPSHSIEFDTGDTIYITYVLTIDGVAQDAVTIQIDSSTVYDVGTTYPVEGQRAYKLYNYLYGTSYSSDAQLEAAGIGDIDISGMSMMLVAAILCDSSEVTGAGQVQAVDGMAANQWGMDFALSIEAMNELATSWAFNIEKTYYNASMRAGDFVFNLYDATSDDGGTTWTAGDLHTTLTNKNASISMSDGYSQDNMEAFSIPYSDEAIQAGETYYYILYEVPDTISSSSGATITFDDTVFGVKVELGTEGEGDDETATITATYYLLTKNDDGTYSVSSESVGDKMSLDDDDYPTFKFENTYQNYLELSGSKTWDDDDNANETRPESITIKLLVNGEPALDENGKEITVEVTEADGWAWSFSDLPQWDGITELVYTIEEDTVDGYVPWYDGNDVTNVAPVLDKYVSDPAYGESTDDELTGDEADNNDTLEYEIKVEHVGHIQNFVIHDYLSDQLDLSTLSIKSVKLYTDESDTEGTEIEYTETEETCGGENCGMDGCSFEISVDDDILADLTADAYIVLIFDIGLDEDAEDFDNDYVDVIPNDAGFSFFATFARPVEVDTYSYGFDLFKYTGNDEPLEGAEFVMSKTDDDGNTVYAQFDVSDSTYLLTGWVDSQDDATAIVSGSDGNAVIEGLHDGTFSIEETKAPDGYQQIVGNITVTITIDEYDPSGAPVITATNATVDGSEVKIENTEGDEDTVTIVGSKTWDDADNADGVRPDSITIHLLADGEEVDSATVTADDNWAWSFKDLAKYQSDGTTEIVYTITEDAVDDYDTTVNSYDVTNTHEYETRDISGSKTWEDDDDKADARPSSITVNLYQDGELYDSKTVTEDDGWAWSWTGLQKNANGEAIAYTITEDAVEYYDTTYYSGSFDITNTFVGEEGAEPGSGQGGDNPKTGDTGNLGTWLAMLIAAMACMLVGFRMRKRS